METKQTRSFEKGKMTGVTWQCDGILLGHAVSRFTELSGFHSKSANMDVVRMHFGLKGDYMFTYNQLGKMFDLVGGHHNIMYSREFEMTVQAKTLEIETFGIQFPKDAFIQFTQNASDTLKRFSEAIILGKSAILTDNWGTIDSPIQQVIQQIIHCKYSESLKKLFLLSKSIELLVLCADACETAERKTETFIKTKTDKEKIIAVRDLINERVHCPPNLSEIAHYVGLNEYKLKKGFKETFNNTIFGYLTDQRLQLAKQYLVILSKRQQKYRRNWATPRHSTSTTPSKRNSASLLFRLEIIRKTQSVRLSGM